MFKLLGIVLGVIHGLILVSLLTLVATGHLERHWGVWILASIHAFTVAWVLWAAIT